MSGLKELLVLASRGKGKGGSAEEAEPPASSRETSDTDDTSEGSYAREAFSAMKDGDEEGFVEAITSMVKACLQAEKSGSYDEG